MYKKGYFLRAFTLLEVLIALFVFLLISVMIASVLHATFQTDKAVKDRYLSRQHQQWVVTLLRRDLTQTFDYPVLDEKAKSLPAFETAKDKMTMTVIANNPLINAKQSVLRVKYFFENHQLFREVCQIEKDKMSTCSKRRMLRFLKSGQFAFVDRQGKSWKFGKAHHLPRGVLMDVDYGKEIHWKLWIMVGGSTRDYD